MKTECDYLNSWMKKKMVTYAKILPKIVKPRDIAGECTRRRMVNPRDIAGECRRRRECDARVWVFPCCLSWGRRCTVCCSLHVPLSGTKRSGLCCWHGIQDDPLESFLVCASFWMGVLLSLQTDHDFFDTVTYCDYFLRLSHIVIIS